MSTEGTAAVPPAAAANAGAVASLQLPTFWPDTPSSWFAFVESKFRVKNVTEEQSKYDLVVSSLPMESIRQVLDILEHPDEEDPYTKLKQRLLDSHEMTDFQSMEMLHRVEPPWCRRRKGHMCRLPPAVILRPWWWRRLSPCTLNHSCSPHRRAPPLAAQAWPPCCGLSTGSSSILLQAYQPLHMM
jgi:hypothetical protein